MMKKIKSEHSYHDSEIVSFSFENDCDLVFEILLNSCWNNKCIERRHLIFHGVRNYFEVKEILDDTIKNKKTDTIDEIVDIQKLDSKYLIDLKSIGSLIIYAKSISET